MQAERRAGRDPMPAAAWLRRAPGLVITAVPPRVTANGSEMGAVLADADEPACS